MDPINIPYETLYAVSTFRALLTPSYCKKVNLFKEFFQNPELTTALHSQEFIQELALLLKDSSLKNKVYFEIAKYYSLIDMNSEDVAEEILPIYKVLSEKIMLKEKKSLRGIPFLIIVLLPFILPYCGVSIKEDDMLYFLLTFSAFVSGCIFIYMNLRLRLSFVLSQILTTLLANAVLFFIYAYHIWTIAFSDPAIADKVYVYMLFLSGAWIVLLVLFTCIRKVISFMK